MKPGNTLGGNSIKNAVVRGLHLAIRRGIIGCLGVIVILTKD